jgi:GNAT superfamily N-acetyltransferase
MKIQKATSKNLNTLGPLFNAYRIFYGQASDLDAAEQFLTERFSKKDSVIFIAEDDFGKGLGFTQLYPSFSSVSMQRVYILNDLFVSEATRGQGVGEALLKHAKQFAISEGAKGLTLETDINNSAQKLYERLGWTKDIDVFHYTWKA